MLVKQLRYINNAACVQRWHVQRVQRLESVGEHTFVVASLLAVLYAHRPSAELLMAALHHDLAESVVGDVPGDFKALDPAVKAALKKAEVAADAKHAWPTPTLTGEEAWALKMCDLLSGMLTAQNEVHGGNHHLRRALQTYRTMALRHQLFGQEELKVNISLIERADALRIAISEGEIYA